MLDPLEIQCQKQRPRKIPHYFFLVTLGNSTFIQPLEIPHTISLIPLEIPYTQPLPPVWIFSGIAQQEKPFKSNSWSDSKTLGEKELKLQP